MYMIKLMGRRRERTSTRQGGSVPGHSIGEQSADTHGRTWATKNPLQDVSTTFGCSRTHDGPYPRAVTYIPTSNPVQLQPTITQTIHFGRFIRRTAKKSIRCERRHQPAHWIAGQTYSTCQCFLCRPVSHFPFSPDLPFEQWSTTQSERTSTTDPGRTFTSEEHCPRIDTDGVVTGSAYPWKVD